MNVSKTSAGASAVRPETTANTDKAKAAQEQRAKSAIQEQQKQNEIKNNQVPRAGDLNITV